MKHKLMIIALIALMALVMMPVQALHPKNITASEAEWGGFLAANAIDGNTGTWTRMVNGNAQLQVCFPSPSNLTSVSGYHAYDGHDYLPRSISVANSSKLEWVTFDVPYDSWNSSDTNPMLMYGECFYVGTDGSWGGFNVTEVEFRGYNATYSDLIPVVDFAGSPLSGTAPLYVSFVDNSTNEVPGSTTYYWSITPTDGVTGRTGTLEDHNALFSVPGNYTISHNVTTPYGEGNMTKTDYITVLNGSVLGTLYITAINSLNGYPIQGATLNLNDVENGTWANATTATGTSQITGIKTHTVNIYASSPGFADNDKLGVPISNVYDSILLFPANMSNVSAGNVTLFVSVYEADDHGKPIANAGVNVVGPSGGQGQYTNGGGTAQFMVANKTTYLIDVQASGHRGATASVYSGTGSGGSASVTVTVYLDKNTVTPTATQTTLPGGGTPGPTLLPGCETNPSSPGCQASQNNEAMAWISANGLGLVQFFVLCFIVFMIKGMGRK